MSNPNKPYWETVSYQQRDVRAEHVTSRIRNEALGRLWRQATKEVEIRHPNPNTFVDLSIEHGSWDGVNVLMRMKNLRDTENLDKIKSKFNSSNPFYMKLHTKEWPGYLAARIAITGACAMYMQHEVCELVADITNPYKRERVVDPHGFGIGRHRQSQLEAVLGSSDSLQDSALVLALVHVIGRDKAKSLITLGSVDAQRQLDIEMAEVEKPSAYWG